MSVVALESQQESLTHRSSEWAASELAGELELNPAFAGFSLSDLAALGQAHGQTLTELKFQLGDICLWVAHYAGPDPVARIAALDAFAPRIYLQPRKLRRYTRTARAFPWHVREQYCEKPWSWFETICDRTSVEGETTEERIARRQDYADRAFELNSRETRELIDSELRPKERGEFLEFEEAPHPAETLAAPPLVTHSALPVTEAAARLTHGLERRLIDEAPGKWSDIADLCRLVVAEHLARFELREVAHV